MCSDHNRCNTQTASRNQGNLTFPLLHIQIIKIREEKQIKFTVSFYIIFFLLEDHVREWKGQQVDIGGFEAPSGNAYFHIFTHLSWLAEATIPVACDWAKADITHSWAATVIHLFSAMFQSSNDWIRTMVTAQGKENRNQH